MTMMWNLKVLNSNLKYTYHRKICVIYCFIFLWQDVFQSLLDLLNWAWTTLCTCIGEVCKYYTVFFCFFIYQILWGSFNFEMFWGISSFTWFWEGNITDFAFFLNRFLQPIENGLIFKGICLFFFVFLVEFHNTFPVLQK